MFGFGYAENAGRWLLMIAFALGLGTYAIVRFSYIIRAAQLIFYT